MSTNLYKVLNIYKYLKLYLPSTTIKFKSPCVSTITVITMFILATITAYFNYIIIMIPTIIS